MGNKLTIGLLSAGISLTPMGKVFAEKASVTTGKNLHSSTVLESASKKLKGLADDAYNASKDFVTSPSEASMPLKSGIAKAIGGEDEFLMRAGARVVSKNSKSTIYQIPNATFSELFYDSDQFFNLIEFDAAKRFVSVPKLSANDTRGFNDIIDECVFKSIGKTTTSIEGGVKSVSKPTNFLKDGENVMIDSTTMTNPDKSSLKVVILTKYYDDIEDYDQQIAKIVKFNPQRQRTEEFYKVFNSETGDAKFIQKEAFLEEKASMLNPYKEMLDTKSAAEVDKGVESARKAEIARKVELEQQRAAEQEQRAAEKQQRLIEQREIAGNRISEINVTLSYRRQEMQMLDMTIQTIQNQIATMQMMQLPAIGMYEQLTPLVERKTGLQREINGLLNEKLQLQKTIQ